jgi:hypothetical protein
MLKVQYIITLFFVTVLSFYVNAQNNNYVYKEITFSKDTILIDTVSVYEFNFKVYADSNVLNKEAYYFDGFHSKLFFNKDLSNYQIYVRYNRMPLNFSKPIYHKSDTLILSDTVNANENYFYSVSKPSNADLFGTSSLQKQGSISRGVTVGNAQNLSLQSTLNLQLSGKIAPNLFIKGAISDNNIPFQPDGNTQKLQDFDQVYLQVYNKDFKITGGDFWLNKPTGYFLNYNKRTQGLSIDYYTYQNDSLKSTQKVSGAFSKGKFARNVIQGTEGNQGPYRLYGAQNEQFIIILAGTEKVYVDGELLTRGQEFDYTIDYNTAEITFTAKRLITKDKRIIVEFQYSDLNYARSLLAYNGDFYGKNYKAWVNFYSEQDSKNQPIQQSLSELDKLLLANAGDSLGFALSNSIDSIGYSDNRVLYKMIDSLGYDSVLVFSTHPDSAIYQATFQFVGDGNGDYILDKYTANGKVYKWVAPSGGIRQGNYAPVRLLKPPQKNQMISGGVDYKITPLSSAKIEMAYSNYDKNTFSNLHDSDDEGVAIKAGLNQTLTRDSLKKKRIETSVNFEYNHKNFTPIQWFRSPEFDRDWNVRNKNFSGDFFLSTADINLINSSIGSIGIRSENLIWGNDYSGWRNNLISNMSANGYEFKLNGSWLVSNGIEKTDFLRHKAALVKNFKHFKIGIEDIHENNKSYQNDVLNGISYQFLDVKSYIGSVDSSQNKFELYYRQRHDWLADTLVLKHTAIAHNIGTNLQLIKTKNNQLKINANYRVLNILDTAIMLQKPENTILGRIENNYKTQKGLLTSNTFYELNSGLELKRQFIFIQVPTGQGTHTWIDYNQDGIKDLGEFEITQFTDQKNYIRVFIPTNDYVRTYSNQFSQTLFIKPERIWRNKKGMKKFIARLSNQTIYKLTRKTNYEKGANAFNPFINSIADTNLISTTSLFRNTLYFNRINSKFGVDITFQENTSKLLLSNGFDSRQHQFIKAKFRWNLNKIHTLKGEYVSGAKISNSDYAPNRNYNINYYEIKPTYSLQPNTKMRFALSGTYSLKQNQSDLNELAIIRDIGMEVRYNQPKKGSFLTQFNFINISYNASNNTSIAYEMLVGLKTGNNFTIGISYQRKVAKNLQLNFNYNGRKSEDNLMIHSGGMELRAFF